MPLRSESDADLWLGAMLPDAYGWVVLFVLTAASGGLPAVARIRQQLYRQERRPERQPVLLFPLAQLSDIAPDALLNDDPSNITLDELNALRMDAAGTSLPVDVIALAEQISAAGESARVA